MKESLEYLKSIIDDAPVDGLATNFYIIYPGEFDIKNYVNMINHTWWSDSMDQWIDWGGASNQIMRSLSDIKEIIELREWQIAMGKKYKHIVEA